MRSRLLDTTFRTDRCVYVDDPYCSKDLDVERLTILQQECDGQENCTVSIMQDTCSWIIFKYNTDYQTITYKCRPGLYSYLLHTFRIINTQLASKELKILFCYGVVLIIPPPNELEAYMFSSCLYALVSVCLCITFLSHTITNEHLDWSR